MKRIVLFFVTLALTGGIQSAWAQGAFKSADAAVSEAESIIRSFSGSSDADAVHIGPLLINIVKPFIDEPKARHAMKMGKGLLVVDLEDCSTDVKSRFASQMGKFIDSLGEMKLMEARDGGDNVIIIGDEKKISGMLVVSSDCEAVLIKLAAKPEDLGKLIQSVN